MARIPISYDTETHLIAPGNLTPRLVCASWQEFGKNAQMDTRKGAIEQGRAILSNEEYVLVAANAAFDMGVLAAADPSLIELIFKAYEEDRISDTHVRQALGDIHDGCLFRDRETNAPLGRYNMAYLAKLYLGLDLTHLKNDASPTRVVGARRRGRSPGRTSAASTPSSTPRRRARSRWTRARRAPTSSPRRTATSSLRARRRRSPLV